MSNIIPNYNNSYAPISGPMIDNANTPLLNNGVHTQSSSSPLVMILYILCCLSVIFCIYSMFSGNGIASILCIVSFIIASSSFISISLTTFSKA